MLTIQLVNLLFHAHHGLYEEEKILGGTYEVNMQVSYKPAKTPIQHIDETIDYTAIYTLVKQHMKEPKLLLETVATMLAHDILTHFSLAEEVSVYIKKIKPPIPNFQGSVAIHFVAKR